MKWLERLLCRHTHIWRTKDGRLFLKCMHCGHESKGIATGGFKYQDKEAA